MPRTLFALTYLIVCASLVLNVAIVEELNSDNTHLEQYDTELVNHHDNIDDTSKPHAHSHKHSNDGEEHEHNHEHSKIAQHELKQIFRNQIELPLDILASNIKCDFQNNLISNPHPFDIFRPPIV